MFVPESMRGNRRDRKRKADDKDGQGPDAMTTDTTTNTNTNEEKNQDQKQADGTNNPPPKKTRKQRKAEKHARWKTKEATKKKEQDQNGWFIQKKQQQQQKEGGGWVGAEQTNHKFEQYYQAQNLVPTSEWSEFMAALRRVLPITFRVSSINGVDKQILSELTGNCFGVKGKMMECGEKKDIKPPAELPWYPDHMGWYIGVSKSEIKRIPELKAFRQFLIGESLQGNITRQEAVSMIPPLLLDVQPHHYVLDMCAAPGSKTAQLLEALHREGPMAPTPTGMVIANDADPRRAYMLVHQLKRLGSAHYLITTHDGQHFPNMFRHVEEKSQEPGTTTIRREIPVEFDRILCDVPCSGDGTLRKNINVWTSWTPQIAIGLHPLQILIAMRGFALLKVNGLMVYSTCSFNPIENEAVVAELLRRSQGALELVDCSDRLAGLIRYPGVTTWRVQDKGIWLENYQACPESRRKAVRKSMFPPTSEEVDKFHLERCVRVFPHSQDTGGFFISLFRKTRHFKHTTPATTATTTTATSTDSKPAEAASTATVTATSTAIVTENAVVSDEMKVAEDEDLDEEALAEATAAAAAVDAGDEEAGGVAVPAAEGQGEGKPKGGRGRGGRKGGKEKKTEGSFNEDPFQPMDTKIHAQIQEYYGFTEELNLFARSSANKRLYYIAPAIAQCLVSTHNQRLKVVHSGNKAIEHCSTRDSSYPLEYRIVQEGVYSIAHLITKQVCYPEYSDFIHLLNTTLIKTTDLATREDEFAKQVKACQNGSVVCIHRSKEQQAVSTRPIVVCVWKTPAGLNLMIPKPERNSLLSLFTKEQAYTEHALRPAPSTKEEHKQTETETVTLTTQPSQQVASTQVAAGSQSQSSAPDVEMS